MISDAGSGPVAAIAATIMGGTWVVGGRSDDVQALSATMNPLRALDAAGLGQITGLVMPLQGVLDRMAGNAAVVRAFVDSWHTVSAGIEEVGQRLRTSVARDTGQWRGAAADGYRGRATTFTGSLGEFAVAAAATASVADTVGQVVAAGRTTAHDLAADLVRRLIALVPQLMAAEGGLTANVLAQAADLVDSYAKPVAAVERQVATTLANATRSVTTLADAVGAITARWDGFASSDGVTGPGGTTRPSAASLPTRSVDQAVTERPKPDLTKPGPVVPWSQMPGQYWRLRPPGHWQPVRAQDGTSWFDKLDLQRQGQYVAGLMNSVSGGAAGPNSRLSPRVAELALRQSPTGTDEGYVGLSRRHDPAVWFERHHPSVWTDKDEQGISQTDAINVYPNRIYLWQRDVAVIPDTDAADAPVKLRQMLQAAERRFQDTPGELWVQVPAGTTPEKVQELANRFMPQMDGLTPAERQKLTDIDVVFMNPNGEVQGAIMHNGNRNDGEPRLPRKP
ncbi:hypothetical protein F4560_000789 [Saccharothrix ecbatanensis]|uniref:WXG100 family type VII secretion target n=1 Tax=Saccharothrix ecbatanensis TaxID=1105145 RepID=A0A7W9HFJ3_9PSEU|nr:hypothetical protein [Saccharothrix ecbatanensis]MBB5801021.1 hypothetical protein [Saccharothrix ecbatanensis]